MPKNKADIEYLEKNQNDLDIIKPLWEKLKEYHLEIATYFKDSLSTVTFDMRKKQLLDKSRDGKLHIDLAKDSVTRKYIGYCVTTLSPEKQGEIDSIYVEKEYRRSGIGDKLMGRALGWLKTMSAKQIIMDVAEGNENVFAFYQRFNFYPRTTILMQKLNSAPTKEQ